MIESLTPSEAAVVAGVSVRDVHRMIDEHILPEALYTATQTRSFKSQACALISFYFHATNRLTSEERQRTITRAGESNPEPQTIQDEFLTIDLTSFHKEVEERLERLQAAQETVVSDPGILSGTPVIRGTRVPVYDVAASVTAGIFGTESCPPSQVSSGNRSNWRHFMLKQIHSEGDRARRALDNIGPVKSASIPGSYDRRGWKKCVVIGVSGDQSGFTDSFPPLRSDAEEAVRHWHPVRRGSGPGRTEASIYAGCIHMLPSDNGEFAH